MNIDFSYTSCLIALAPLSHVEMHHMSMLRHHASHNNSKNKMKETAIILENRTARLTTLIDPDKKKAFEELCVHLDTTPSQAIRRMIRSFLADHNVIWTKGDDKSEQTN